MKVFFIILTTLPFKCNVKRKISPSKNRIMELKLKAETKWGPQFNGNLDFESNDKKVTIHYSFKNGQPTESLREGSEIDITFQIGEKELPIVGVFPGVLGEVPPLAQCIWVLASNLIYSNVFHILASQSEPGEITDVYEISQEMSGEVPEQCKILFE